MFLCKRIIVIIWLLYSVYVRIKWAIDSEILNFIPSTWKILHDNDIDDDNDDSGGGSDDDKDTIFCWHTQFYNLQFWLLNWDVLYFIFMNIIYRIRNISLSEFFCSSLLNLTCFIFAISLTHYKSIWKKYFTNCPIARVHFNKIGGGLLLR